MTDTLYNWAGNFAYSAKTVHAPRNEAELCEIVRGVEKARALGSRHSFNRIADTDADLISTQNLSGIVSLDKAAMTVTVRGGTTYSALCPALDAKGYALHNLASLPHISVVGAVMTSTHGSGNKNGTLASAVAGLRIVAADGGIVSLTRGDADFNGAVVSLGALGVVSEITLDIEPRYEMRQNVFLNLSFANLIENFDAITSAAYSVSCFTKWQGDSVDLLWLKNREGAEAPAGDFYGARPAEAPVHPIPGLDPGPTTGQLGMPGSWYERLPHFGMGNVPSAGEELQSEYFVARDDAPAALQAVKSVQDRFSPLLLTSEIRMMAADALWLSQSYGADRAGLHFTWRRDWPAVRAVLPVIEAALAPFRPIPHWGKLFTLPASEVQSRYQRLGDFRDLANRCDPGAKFRNDFVSGYVF
jgi:xylitol oxidase